MLHYNGMANTTQVKSQCHGKQYNNFVRAVVYRQETRDSSGRRCFKLEVLKEVPKGFLVVVGSSRTIFYFFFTNIEMLARHKTFQSTSPFNLVYLSPPGHKLKYLTQGINEQTVEYSIIIGKDNSEVRHSRVNPILGYFE